VVIIIPALEVMIMAQREVRQVFTIKFTKAEKALLEKRAKKAGVTEADHLRACMVMDALVAGDVEALKVVGGTLREILAERIKMFEAQGVLSL
jgi:hypothetical protein